MQYYKQYIIWLLNLYDYKNGITRQNTLFGLSITSAMLFCLYRDFIMNSYSLQHYSTIYGQP